MRYLLDTNIVSELGKVRTDPRVLAWFEATAKKSLYTSVLVLGEHRRGLEQARLRDAAKSDALERSNQRATVRFHGRCLPVDRDVCEIWGRTTAHRPVAIVDVLLGATAKTHSMTYVTRNTKDVANLGVALLDPFAT